MNNTEFILYYITGEDRLMRTMINQEYKVRHFGNFQIAQRKATFPYVNHPGSVAWLNNEMQQLCSPAIDIANTFSTA